MTKYDENIPNGDCGRCRKQQYCSKPCTAAKRRMYTLPAMLVTKAMMDLLKGDKVNE